MDDDYTIHKIYTKKEAAKLIHGIHYSYNDIKIDKRNLEHEL